MIKKLISLSLILAITQCSSGTIVDTCTETPVKSNVHPSVKNSPQYNDNNPSNDFEALDQSLNRTPGVYTTSIKIGPNGTPVDVVIDTGSARLLIGTQSFTPSGNPLGAPQPDGYGSCQAEATDYASLVGLSCGASINQTIASTATQNCPNIMGLAYHRLNQSLTHTFMGDLVTANKINDIFSLVMCGQQSGSQILLGGTITGAPANLSYTSILDESYYVINAISLDVADAASPATFQSNSTLGNGGTTIIDSGTTLALVPQNIFNNIVSAIQKIRPDLAADFFTTTNPSDPNYTLSSSELGDISKLPNLTLVLAGKTGNINVTITPSTYMKALDGNNIIFGFRPWISTPTDPFPILGQSIWDQQYLVFDRANKQIGIAPAGTLCHN